MVLTNINSKKLYIDANLLVYAIEDSKNLYGKEISSSSSNLFFEAASCKYHVIISTWALEELARIKKLEQTQMLFNIIKKKIIPISYSDAEMQQAKQQNPAHFQDELHGILALREGADYIVTRNVEDFERFKDRIK